MNHAFQYIIHAQGFFDHGVEFREEWVLGVGLVIDLATIFRFVEEAGVVELFEFFTYLAGRKVEFTGQFPQICVSLGVQEETHQNLNTCL